MSQPRAGASQLLALDGLRAVAALMVVLTHVGFLTGAVSHGVVGRLLGRGDLGVAIFFGLSGFLLHRSLLAEHAARGRVSVGRYLVRRAARVLPAFWLGLAVVALAVQPSGMQLLTNATLTHIYVPGALIDGYTQTWSLATEASFYVLLPLVFVALVRWCRTPGGRLRVLGLSWLAGVGLAAASGVMQIGGQDLAGRWLTTHWPSFVLGMALAELVAQPDHRLTRSLRDVAALPGTCLAVAAGAYLLATTTAAGPLTLAPLGGAQQAGKAALGCALTGALMVPLIFAGGRNHFGALLGSPVSRYLGRISYGVFLWHLPVFEALYSVTGLHYFSGGAAVLLAVGLPISVGVAALSERWLERPVMDFVHARYGSRQAPARQPARTTT